MSSEEAISGQLSAVSPQAGDPLADVRCLHCGYSLRGLPEDRCPECGTPFDPKEMATSFVARWPRLLMWYLIVHVVQSLFDMPWVVHRISSWFGPAASGVGALNVAVATAHLLNTATILLLGPLAIWGLHHRRHWARRACIAIFATQCLHAIVSLWPQVQVMAASHRMMGTVNSLIMIASVASTCILPLLLGLFLVTGLRPHSLTRYRAAQPPLLPLRLFQPRHDWLLLVVLVLAGLGLRRVCAGVSSLSGLMIYQWSSPSWSVNRADLIFSAIYSASGVAAAICALVAAVRIWRKPKSLRPMLTAVTTLSAVQLLLAVVYFVTHPARLRDLMQAPQLDYIASLTSYFLSPLLVPLVLLLFTFLAVDREDIERLAWQESKRV